MIVCHCNRITSGDIDDAVGCLMSSCAHPELCPENVYEELGACARCCHCFPLAEKMIDESRLAFVSRTELARLRGEEAGDDGPPTVAPIVEPLPLVGACREDAEAPVPPSPSRRAGRPVPYTGRVRADPQSAFRRTGRSYFLAVREG